MIVTCPHCKSECREEHIAKCDVLQAARIAALEAENERLLERHLDAAINAGDAYVAAEKRAEAAERQLAEAREERDEWLRAIVLRDEGGVGRLRDLADLARMRQGELKRAALAPAEKPGSDGPADLPRRPMPSSYTAFDGPSAEPASDGECQS